MEYKVLIDDVDYTDYVPIPLSEQLSLDESLDCGYLQLLYTDKDTPFYPLAKVNITITNNAKTRQLDYFVSSDETEEVILSKKTNHSILLIEQSKWLERFIGSIKTVTNPLVKNYIDNSGDVYCKIDTYKNTSTDTWYAYSDKYKSCILEGQLYIYSPKEWFELSSSGILVDYLCKVTKGDVTVWSTTNFSESTTINVTAGTYHFYYQYAYMGGSADDKEYNFDIVVFDENSTREDKTITEVVNIVLETIETLRSDEQPRFIFDKTQAEKYSKVISPEFTLTGTLWEMLSQIGSYINAIPRLRNGVIRFDELGSSTMTDVDLNDYISHTEKFDIEQFATHIDSSVDNLVNLDDEKQGVVYEPDNNFYKTVRCETTTAQLTNDNAFIQTSEPIEKLIKVECGYLSDETLVGDITPYIYSDAEYATLSSYDDSYPLSKAFALYYTVGQKNIYGLNFTLPSAFILNFNKASIFNIIARKTNKQPSDVAKEDMIKLQFRVTYIPLVSARVGQSKIKKDDIMVAESTLAYNQSSQQISSIAYGENMRGTIAKLGNPEKTYVYVFNSLDMIPKVGDLFDKDYYISIVKCEYYDKFIKCSIGLSKNYNKLSEYVGIKDEIRFYEISEKQSQNRHILYRDYCVVGKADISDGKALITNEGLDVFAKTFNNTNNDIMFTKISSVNAHGYDYQNNELNSAHLPVTSLSFGNSMIFNYHYKDNYSAGEYVEEINSTKVQNMIRYTDEYGELKSLEFYMGYMESSPANYYESSAIGMILPALPITTQNMFSTQFNNIIIDKDNRENIIFNYQIDFVVNDNNLIIGTGITNECVFVKNLELYDISFVVYNKPCLSKNIKNRYEIQEFEIEDMTNNAVVLRQNIDYDNKSVSYSFTMSKSDIQTTKGFAWAVYKAPKTSSDMSEQKFLFGKNEIVEMSLIFDNFYSLNMTLPTFTFTHKLQGGNDNV